MQELEWHSSFLISVIVGPDIPERWKDINGQVIMSVFSDIVGSLMDALGSGKEATT